MLCQFRPERRTTAIAHACRTTEAAVRRVLSAELLDALDHGALDGAGLLQIAREQLAWPGSYDDLASAWGAAFEPDAAVLAVAGRLRVPAALLTNNGAPLADRFAQLLPSAAAVVRASFFSAQLSTTKPDGAACLRASERLGHAPSATLLVDDSEANVRAARAAGLDALQFTGATALARDPLGAAVADTRAVALVGTGRQTVGRGDAELRTQAGAMAPACEPHSHRVPAEAARGRGVVSVSSLHPLGRGGRSPRRWARPGRTIPWRPRRPGGSC